ncbi:MAG: DHH family phosphoesterase [Metamycoplasmataceae bacterium]
MNIYKEINKLISQHENIVIFHHINPDGDCLGSQFGLKKLIQDNYLNKNVYVIGNSENVLNFMEFKHDEIPNEDILKNALAIIVDANYSNRIKNSELLLNGKIKNILRIDHHPYSDDLNTVFSWVDESYVASCEQITELAMKLNWKISQEAAEYLYLGLITDSGRFFYEKTSSRTHEIASFLFKQKINFFEIHKKMSQRSLKEITFLKEVLSNYQYEEKVIYYFLSQDKIKQLKLENNEMNRVDFLANIDNFHIWIFFIEQDDKKIRVRIRSNGPIINKLAEEFNGGGHQLAAGAFLESKEQISVFIKRAISLI